LTGDSLPEDFKIFMNAGADLVLSKPANSNTLGRLFDKAVSLGTLTLRDQLSRID